MSYNPILRRVSALGISAANSSLSIPANAVIHSITVVNKTANAITGGLKFGTTNGGTDVVAALTVGSSALAPVLDAALLLRMFSTTLTQNLYVDAVVAWNSASVDIHITYIQL